MTPQDFDSSPDNSPDDKGTGIGLYAGRRRLLRGTLATGPVLLTLVSRPVMADLCVSPSVGLSANLSRTGMSGELCQGKSPITWSRPDSFRNWPSPTASPGPVAAAAAPVAEPASSAKSKPATTGNPSTLDDAAPAKAEKGGGKDTATTFNSVFGNAGGYPKKSLLEILSLNTSRGRDGMASHLAAAYLNALTGLTPAAVLDVSLVKNIWASFVARGYYEPTAGIKWYPDYAEPASPRGGMIAWLKTTMPN